jgi:hypothetical protein
MALLLQVGHLLLERDFAHNPASVRAQKLSDFKVQVHRFASQ